MNNLYIQLRQIDNGYLIQSYSGETFCESLPDAFKKIEEEAAVRKNRQAAETTPVDEPVTYAGITQ